MIRGSACWRVRPAARRHPQDQPGYRGDPEDPGGRRQVKAQFAIPVTDTVEQFNKQIKDETAHLTEVFKEVTN